MLSIYFISGSVTTALHPYKSDAITLGTAQRAHSLPHISTVTVADAIVPISDHVKLLGVTLDNRLSFDTHISAMSKLCFFSIFEFFITSVQDSPQMLPRALHALSLIAVLTIPMQPWSASGVRISNASCASKTHWLEW